MDIQKTSGVHKMLSNPVIYKLFQSLVGGSRIRRRFIKDYVQIRANEFVIDIGCGPGNLLAYMPTNISYIGIDLSESYINEARKKYGDRGKFIRGDCNSASKLHLQGNTDVVICGGLLHHVDDLVIKSVFSNAYTLLKPEGRFLCLEPVWLRNHPYISRLVMKSDRGKNIKTETEWLRMAKGAFPSVSTVTTIDFLFPYYYIILTCKKNPARSDCFGE